MDDLEKITVTFKRYSRQLEGRRIYADTAEFQIPQPDDVMLGYLNVSEVMAGRLNLDSEFIRVTIERGS